MESLVEANIDDLAHVLAGGGLTAVELVAKYLHRIAKYDWNGIQLNSIPLLNSRVFQEAAASDDYRAVGLPIRPLEGIPCTVKDNFAVAGMTAASGSPAFSNLRPRHDAFVVERLRAAGAILLGKTNMSPMAAGGMQRGLYGRAESPYNMDYLTAAFSSGSSNGCGTSTAASFAAFGLGSETVSSGRAPASNNALVAYTPSRGLVSCRGLWPLYATCDVVVPYAKSVGDMLKILDILVTPDPCTDGDFWRYQNLVLLPELSSPCPTEKSIRSRVPSIFKGKRLGVPRMFIASGEDAQKASERCLNPSVIRLWTRAREDLESLGAEIIETDFPILTNYEGADSSSLPLQGLGWPPGWLAIERGELLALTWERYLQWAEDPNYPSLGEIDPLKIFPKPEGYLPDKFMDSRMHLRYPELVQMARKGELEKFLETVDVKAALESLEAHRKRDLEDWMDQQGLDLLVFPANGDVGRADLETNEQSARHALGNGVRFSNGNRVIRHCGIPTVSLSMGLMSDTGMPVNLTFMGKAYQDYELLSYAYAYESQSHRRVPPPLTPALSSDTLPQPQRNRCAERVALTISSVEHADDAVGGQAVCMAGTVQVPSCEDSATVEIFVDGDQVCRIDVSADDAAKTWQRRIVLPQGRREQAATRPSIPEYQNPVAKTMIVVLARAGQCLPSGELVLIDKKV